MPIETIPGTSLTYYLIAFDQEGNERLEPNGHLLSEQIFAKLTQEPITDILIMSHGWLGDLLDARNQYQAWIGAMIQQTADFATLKQVRPEFNPLWIGFHWPSKPWGHEDLQESVSAVTKSPDQGVQFVDKYQHRLVNTKPVQQALQLIFRTASTSSSFETLPSDVLNAYQVLDHETRLERAGDEGAPGADWEKFDPEAIYQGQQDWQNNGLNDSQLGQQSCGNPLLEPLRVLSFWTMKARARKIGESSGFKLLTALQAQSRPDTRFHLIGHSFGTIVVSSMVNGPQGQGILPRPVHSLSLLQGAVSLWSYCAKIAYERDRPGYFHPIITHKKVTGPILATYSIHDYAVGRMYPLAGQVAFSAVDFAPGQLPKYGGIGSFGIAGDELGAQHLKMHPVDTPYEFKLGKIYNLESSKYICDLSPGFLIGAHSDIAKPEVAHAIWSAVCTS